MRTFLALLSACILLTSCSTPPEVPATRLEKANVLPLALDDHFQFRKISLNYYDSVNTQVQSQSEVVNFERMRLAFGAVSADDRNRRYGNYFSFFWRATAIADVTIRLEYRQASLGDYVMAAERYYPGAHGSYESKFSVIGDEFLENGRVTSWRALLIVNGRIVGFRQSFLWR